MGLAKNQGQVPIPTQGGSPHECLVVSDLKPAPRPIPRSRNWFQIRHHQAKSCANDASRFTCDPARDSGRVSAFPGKLLGSSDVPFPADASPWASFHLGIIHLQATPTRDPLFSHRVQTCKLAVPAPLALAPQLFRKETSHLYAGGSDRRRHEIRGGRSVARGHRTPPETAQDLLALTGKVGFEFGTAAQDGWGTGKAREW
jgi:hypothetical protein